MNAYFGGIHPGRGRQKARIVGLVLGLSLVVAFAVLGFLILNYDSSKATINNALVQEEVPPIEMVDVLVPIQSIDPGVKLEPTMFRKESRPKQGLSRRVVRDFEEIKGSYARSLIAADAPLLSDYITSVKPSSVITPEIPEGYRAITIRVDATSAVEGWARPGARVDVIWTTKFRGKQIVRTIVQNAKILSAERLTEAQISMPTKSVGVPSTVTLLVTSQDAKKIQLARSTGSLSLSLRGDQDLGKSDMGGAITFEDLLGTENREPDQDPSIEGTLEVGGVQYKVIHGKLVPASELEKRGKRR